MSDRNVVVPQSAENTTANDSTAARRATGGSGIAGAAAEAYGPGAPRESHYTSKDGKEVYNFYNCHDITIVEGNQVLKNGEASTQAVPQSPVRTQADRIADPNHSIKRAQGGGDTHTNYYNQYGDTNSRHHHVHASGMAYQKTGPYPWENVGAQSAPMQAAPRPEYHHPAYHRPAYQPAQPRPETDPYAYERNRQAELQRQNAEHIRRGENPADYNRQQRNANGEVIYSNGQATGGDQSIYYGNGRQLPPQTPDTVYEGQTPTYQQGQVWSEQPPVHYGYTGPSTGEQIAGAVVAGVTGGLIGRALGGGYGGYYGGYGGYGGYYGGGYGGYYGGGGYYQPYGGYAGYGGYGGYGYNMIQNPNVAAGVLGSVIGRIIH